MDTSNLYRTLTRVLPLAGSRALANGPTVAELDLEARFAESLEPALVELYRLPLQGSTPTDVEQILAIYDNEEATAVLAFVLRHYILQGVNIGGALGLDELGLAGEFELTNEARLSEIDELVTSLTAVDGQYSLTRTTANELARWIEQDSDLSAQIDSRSLVRAGNIAQTEGVRSTRMGLMWLFAGNGITHTRFKTQNDGDVCEICEPLHGNVYRNEAFPTIPIHVGCRCYPEPVLEDWLIPTTIWLGGDYEDAND